MTTALIPKSLRSPHAIAPRQPRLDSRVRLLAEAGQSVWIDWLSRDLLQSGQLERLIAEHGVSGITTNPTIFERALGSGDYDAQLTWLLESGKTPREAIEEVAATDVIDAATQLFPIWVETHGRDGYVSWELDPAFAWSARKTVAEVERLRKRLALPNVLIKIPATEPGLVAIEDSIARGFSVNATLIFSVERYAAVAEAYLRGLRRAADEGIDVATIHSVASFFVSRLDGAADALLATQRSSIASARQGRLAIATAKLAYRHFHAVFGGRRWESLCANGARPQRLLWASTATKNRAHRDVRYVEGLIGPKTITTLAAGTFEAFLDHGTVAETLTGDSEPLPVFFGDLEALGVDLGELADRLEEDGVAKFRRSQRMAETTVGRRANVAR